MYWQANVNTPLSVTPLLDVPWIIAFGLNERLGGQ